MKTIIFIVLIALCVWSGGYGIASIKRGDHTAGIGVLVFALIGAVAIATAYLSEVVI